MMEERDRSGRTCLEIAEDINVSEDVMCIVKRSLECSRKPTTTPIATPIDIWDKAFEEISSTLQDATVVELAKESILDQQFFEKVATRNHRGNILEAYKAVHNWIMMVLFSMKTLMPLASLTLKADDLGCLSMLTARPPPKEAHEAYFQGMLNQLDQSFMFIILNLSDEGSVNFDVLYTRCPASRISPGWDYAVNKRSLLRLNQSHIVEANARNNRRMVLGGKTKKASFPI
jgi:hypothetical protein